MENSIAKPIDRIASAGSIGNGPPKPTHRALPEKTVAPFNRYPSVKKLISKPIPSRSADIDIELAEVTSAWRIYRTTNGRDAVYTFLSRVFAVVTRWQHLNCAVKNSRAALRRQLDAPQMKPEPFGIVIYCTSDPEVADAKTRSKWSRALRFARKAKPANQRLTDFIKSKGGLNQCAARFARGSMD
jgi:hypothetical protein